MKLPLLWQGWALHLQSGINIREEMPFPVVFHHVNLLFSEFWVGLIEKTRIGKEKS
jgi:hypothetical protein